MTGNLYEFYPLDEFTEDAISIFCWPNGDDPLEITWREGESWCDLVERYEIKVYDTFYEFMDSEKNEEISSYSFPYSVTVYKLLDCFLICSTEIQEFTELSHCCCVKNNYLNVIHFYKEMCLPFIGVK